MIAKIYNSWAVRHVHPVNYTLHMIGIPMTLAGIAAFILGKGWLGLILFAGGYALQFVGHAVEGNEVGEVTLFKVIFKKLLGKRPQ